MALGTAIREISLVDHIRANIQRFPEGSSQSFKKGDPVILSSGLLIAPSTDPDAITILGIAMEDASGTSGTMINVALAEPGVMFEANLGSTAGTNYEHEITDIGKVASLLLQATTDQKSGTNDRIRWTIKPLSSATAKACARILRQVPGDNGKYAAYGSGSPFNTRVIFTFVNTAVCTSGYDAT